MLENGQWFVGESLGALGPATGEAVFVTGMTGYQEILSDPSYAGQIVVFTYPMIGNYGINTDDFESASIQPRALVMHQVCDAPSNWRSQQTLPDFLQERQLVAIQGVDTRAVTTRIREGGAMMATITSSETPEEALVRLRSEARYDAQNYVQEVSTKEPYVWGRDGRDPFDPYLEGYRYRLAVFDCGVKYNILRRLAAAGCLSMVVPHDTPADEILALPAQAVVLSPGPGDPDKLSSTVKTVRELIGKKPIFGICLGHQLLALALGGRTEKLKFGHHGSNHPVREMDTGKVVITSQNHGYAVVAGSLLGSGMEITQEHVNDGSVEGFRHRGARLMAIQYHPEAAPGPWDGRHYFPEFLSSLDEW